MKRSKGVGYTKGFVYPSFKIGCVHDNVSDHKWHLSTRSFHDRWAGSIDHYIAFGLKKRCMPLEIEP
jgi:hypothetical protein